MMAPLFSSKLLLVLFFGTLFGLILGVLPGLGPTTGGALILPFTMTLDPLSAIVLLTSIYCAGTYGGAITAVLINTPGTPAAAATCLDGYPLAQKGEAGRALGMATVSSTVGGIFSVIVLVFFAPFLAQLAYEFGQPEYFALAIFGLSMLASISSKSPVKNLIGGLIGLFVATIGVHLTTGISRFTFGVDELFEGISFVPVLIGLFAMSEILVQASKSELLLERIKFSAIKLPSISEFKSCGKSILRSSGIGTFIGILPAEGGTVSAIPDDLRIDFPQLLNSLIEGNLIAENFILSNNSSLLDACTSISDMANNPIKTGTKLIPSNNSSTPKVNLEIPVVK
jgi:putative tricarboxylic transport membrane protein